MNRNILRWAAVWVFLQLAVGLGALGPVVRVALGANKPPYIIPDPPGGIEYDLVRLVVEGMGATPDIAMVPNARAQEMLRLGRVDAAFGQEGEFVSQPYIAYQNVVVTLQTRGIVLKTVADLGDYRVTAFQNARIFLGPSFRAMADLNADYREVSPQLLANQLLFSGRTDVVVSDINIFTYLNARAEEEVNVHQTVTIHRMFPPTRYSLVFRDPALRDAFDASLKRVLKSDPYTDLARKYLPPGTQVTFRP